MNIPYELWPIWCDYLEEQSYDTELLRYVLTWGINTNNGYDLIDYPAFAGIGYLYHYSFSDLGAIFGCRGTEKDTTGYFNDYEGIDNINYKEYANFL